MSGESSSLKQSPGPTKHSTTCSVMSGQTVLLYNLCEYNLSVLSSQHVMSCHASITCFFLYGYDFIKQNKTYSKQNFQKKKKM